MNNQPFAFSSFITFMVQIISSLSFVRRWSRLLALLLGSLLALALPTEVFGQATAHPWTWATPMEHPTQNGSFSYWGASYPVSTVIDGAGNQYVTGAFRGRVAFGATVLNSHSMVPENTDLYVAKLSPQGQWLWAVNAGTTAPVVGFNVHLGTCGDALACDGQGNIYVAGAFHDSVTFGGTTLYSGYPGYQALFVAKLSPQGQWLSATAAPIVGGTPSSIYPIGLRGGARLAVTRGGTAYVAGSYGGALAFGAAVVPEARAAWSFVARLSPAGQWQWVRTNYPMTAAQFANESVLVADMALGPNGRLTLAGVFYNAAVQFGGHSVMGSGQYGNDVFVSRLDTAGQWLSVVAGGGTGYEYPVKLTIDTADNTYLSGSSQFSSPSFGPYTIPSAGAGMGHYLARLSPGGIWQSAQSGRYPLLTYDDAQNELLAIRDDSLCRFDINGQPLRTTALQTGFDGSYMTYAAALAVGAQGEVAVAGRLQGQGLVGTTPLTTSVQEASIFAARLSAARQVRWAAQAETGGTLVLTDVVSDAQGNTFAVGTLSGTVAFGASLVTATEGSNMVLAKFSRQGQPQWLTQPGGYRAGQNIALDGQGNVLVTSSAFDTLRPRQFIWHGELSKFSPQGQLIWTVPAPDVAPNGEGNFAGSLAADGSGTVWLAGSFPDTLHVGTRSWLSRGNFDGYVARVSASGQWLGLEQIGGPEAEAVTGVSTDRHGNAYVTGLFSRTLQLGASTLTGHDTTDLDAFVARLTPSGQWRWAVVIGGAGADLGSAVVVEPAGRYAIVAGQMADSISFGAAGVLLNRDPVFSGQRSYTARLDSAGQWQWATLLTGTGQNWLLRLTLDAMGTAYAHGGVAMGSVRLGADSVTARRVRPVLPAVADGVPAHQRPEHLLGGGPPPPFLVYNDFLGVISATGQWLWGTDQVGTISTASATGDVFTVLAHQFADTLAPFVFPQVVQTVSVVAGMLNPITRLPEVSTVPGAELVLWPNPAHSSVRLIGIPIGTTQALVLDATGRSARTLPLAPGGSSCDLDLRGLPPGLYVVRAGGQTRRLVVQP